MKDWNKAIDNVIRRFGFEAKETIEFCTLVERNKKVLATMKYLRWFGANSFPQKA